jgi:hypothetical protein
MKLHQSRDGDLVFTQINGIQIDGADFDDLDTRIGGSFIKESFDRKMENPEDTNALQRKFLLLNILGESHLDVTDSLGNFDLVDLVLDTLREVESEFGIEVDLAKISGLAKKLFTSLREISKTREVRRLTVIVCTLITLRDMEILSASAYEDLLF